MKGVVLAGGLGTRLNPLTRVTNKHLLPVYDRPMIYYPLETLVSAGIDDILLVTGGNNAGDFLRLLGNGKEFGLRHLNYTYQEGEGGIAEALGLCEYFADNGPIVVILGDTGRNFGAGMSNGIAYVLDENGQFPSKLNPEMLALRRVVEKDDVEIVQTLIKRHVQLTGSPRGQDILDAWDDFRPKFWKVAPHSAMTEEGPQTIIRRHLESLRSALAVG